MASTKIETRVWDAAEHLQDEEAIRLYIEAAQEEAPDDAAFLAKVLGDVARARNISELSRQTGIACPRPSLDPAAIVLSALAGPGVQYFNRRSLDGG